MEGGGGQEKKRGFLLFPLPPLSFPFFCSRLKFLDELARKRLLRRLNNKIWIVEVVNF